MYPVFMPSILRRAAVAAAFVAGTIAVAGAANWPEWRGPSRDGHSTETNLPAKWSPAGDNLAWRIPIGSRSSPVVFGTSGSAPESFSRADVMCTRVRASRSRAMA